MKIDVKNWNPDVRFDRMTRFRKKEVMNLKPGDRVYYVNLCDDLVGIVYGAEILETHKHQITMEVFPVLDTVPDGTMVLKFIKPHIESFAFNDACEDTYQILFKNIVLSEELEERMYDTFVR